MMNEKYTYFGQFEGLNGYAQAIHSGGGLQV